MDIVFVVVLIAWLAIGVVVVALLNLAKFVVRSSRRVPSSVSRPSTALSAVDDHDGAAQSFGSAPPRHPGTAALPPPRATHRSA